MVSQQMPNMKTSLLYLGLGLAPVYANINFYHVPLNCDADKPNYTGCLRGQMCMEDGSCVAGSGNLYPESFQRPAAELGLRQTPVFSTDGSCGPNNGNTVCDPNSTAYTGGCCSMYGFCGDTADYCGAGCISGCTATPSTAPRSDGRCGSAFGGATCDPNGPYGGCCSSFGYCGSTTAHCSLDQGCQSGCTSGTGSADPRPDGRCGSAFDGATCDPNGPYGGCCSSFGFCGVTPQHCLVANGCQSGCTGAQPSATVTIPASASTGEPVIGKPTNTAPASGGAVTTDGTCGAAYANSVCGNWPQGSCCSMYGYCGNTSAHCGDGCQSGPCSSTPAVPAPGPSPAPAAPVPGTLAVVGQAGVPAMHAGLMPNGRVIFLDKIENYTQITLPDGQFAYSAEYDPETNTVVGLQYKTNAFCSGGAFLPDGRWLSLGGNANLSWLDPTVGDGWNAIRYLSRSSSDASLDGQSWSEPGNKLASNRWYASAQTLPDGSIFVASGSLNGLDPTVPANNNPTWELLNNEGISNGVNVPMDILAKNQPYYMYPFMHLMNDGNLFVFVSKSAESFNVGTNTTVTTYPDLPGDFRTYPNTGGSVLLPMSSATNWAPDIIICGGGAYQDITSPTDPSCGRIQPLSTNPTWEMDSMPEGRGMVEGTMLPDGTVVFVNGCNLGAEGFGLAADPTYEVLLYNYTAPLGRRFSVGPTSQIARLYHSVALLLLDGTLMIAGSNPVQMPVLTPVPNQVPSEDYVTEFRVENYVPPYLQGANANRRPTNVKISSLTLPVGTKFTITFTAPAGAQGVKVSLYHGGYVTHSVHMNHRMAFLDNSGWVPGSTSQTLSVTMPPNANVAPPGPYVIYVVVDNVPAMGQFVSCT